MEKLVPCEKINNFHQSENKEVVRQIPWEGGEAKELTCTSPFRAANYIAYPPSDSHSEAEWLVGWEVAVQ